MKNKQNTYVGERNPICVRCGCGLNYWQRFGI